MVWFRHIENGIDGPVEICVSFEKNENFLTGHISLPHYNYTDV